jgi:phospholipid transport system substrate-binding protein
MTMRNTVLVTLVLLAMATFASTALAADAAGGPADSAVPDKDPKALIEDRHQKIRHYLSESPKLSVEEVRDGVRKVLLSFVDFERVSEMAFKKHFKKLTEDQRKSYVQAFRGLVQATYLKRLEPGKKFEMEFRGEPDVVKDKARAKTTIKSGDHEVDVDYLLYLGEDSTYRAYDLVIDEVSMARNYRKEFYKLYKDKGLDGLLKRIENRTKEKEAGK